MVTTILYLLIWCSASPDEVLVGECVDLELCTELAEAVEDLGCETLYTYKGGTLRVI